MIKITFFCKFDANFVPTKKWRLSHTVNIAHPDHIQNAIDGEYATHSQEGWKHEIELDGTLPATICYFNDTYPATVRKIDKSGKKLWLTEDHYTFNAAAETQFDYTEVYADQPEMWTEYKLNKHGRWIKKGCSSGPALSIGRKRFYQNPEI